MNLETKVKLADGHAIPQFGFGCYEAEGRECYDGVRHALDAGYRHIDSAEWYENEAECGQAINDWLKANNAKREDIYYTTKLRDNFGYKHVKDAIQRSLEACKLGYIDLYLIHGPYPDKQMRLESWKAIEEAKDAGFVRSIGVSNYGERHLEELYDSNPRYCPVVNQIDLHPFMARTELVKYCRSKNIVCEAWGSLVRGKRFDHPVVVDLSKGTGKTPAQVLLRWGLQKNFVVLVKSVNRNRIYSNADVYDFELSEAQMSQLDGLDENLVTDWDPIGDKDV